MEPRLTKQFKNRVTTKSDIQQQSTQAADDK
jgi:hypothetical protein